MVEKRKVFKESNLIEIQNTRQPYQLWLINLLRRKVFKESNLIEIQMQDNHINYD
jgi:hypothetical protein